MSSEEMSADKAELRSNVVCCHTSVTQRYWVEWEVREASSANEASLQTSKYRLSNPQSSHSGKLGSSKPGAQMVKKVTRG